ncbi:MAG: RimK family alpha-L-glutamate ligase [Betaproteobacteria bacterium]|nr:RimK family alpha-L-glutamate ligase [Betaproteobacteria bacterium]
MTPEFHGMAALMTQAFRGVDLTPIGNELIERAGKHPGVESAATLLDLSILLHLKGSHDIALSVQAQALQLRQIYTLPAAREPSIRLLAFMTPGDLSANTPLEFLAQGSDIELTLLYLSPTLPFPQQVPEHDVAFVAVGESESSQPLLRALSELAKIWPRPVLNAPERIARLSRSEVSRLLSDAPGVAIPHAARISREQLQRLAAGENLAGMLPDASGYPIIVRPLDSHAGKGLIKAEAAESLASYLEVHSEPEFFVARFVDYRGDDGLFRKYRIVLIDGKPYASHMALSDHWMIHYLNGGMTESAEKRAEEALFMERFDTGFAARHKQALEAIHERMGLDYLVIDCAETCDGELLVFEVDSSAVVHAMDPEDLFPYKRPQMEKVFSAFKALLQKTAARPCLT